MEETPVFSQPAISMVDKGCVIKEEKEIFSFSRHKIDEKEKKERGKKASKHVPPNLFHLGFHQER